MPSKLITIGEILEMRPGDRQNATWINDDFEAVVSDIKRGSGKAPDTAVLTDAHSNGIAIVANFFGRDPSRFGGKVCHFSGKGMTRTEYKGVQQVTISEKATVQVVGDAPAGSGGARSAASSGASGGGHGSAGSSSSVIHGATVGQALNQACENIRLQCHQLTPEAIEAYYSGASFSKDLWTQTSDIIRIARVLEAGKLAESPKTRNEDPQDKAKREADEKAAAEKAEAERRAKEEEQKKKDAANRGTNPDNTGGNIDEDVPF